VWAPTADGVAGAGTTYASGLGLAAEPSVLESERSDRHALLEGARAARASAILVGSRGRVLGSVASGLVHAAERPVIVVPAA
jgi:nucleotide-binding universal stress UspA family protein